MSCVILKGIKKSNDLKVACKVLRDLALPATGVSPDLPARLTEFLHLSPSHLPVYRAVKKPQVTISPTQHPQTSSHPLFSF